MIKIDSIVKCYGDFRALDKVSFEIPLGTVYGLVGVNGAGKSTLLRTMAGIFKPEGGKVTYDGQAVFDNPDSVIIAVVLIDDGQAGADFAEEGEAILLFWGSGSVVNLVGEVGDAGDAAHFGEVANKNLFGGGEAGDDAIFGVNAEANQDGLFELADALASNREHIADLF